MRVLFIRGKVRNGEGCNSEVYNEYRVVVLCVIRMVCEGVFVKWCGM